MPLARVCNCNTDNLPASIHFRRIEGKQRRTRSREGIKIPHDTVPPNENRAVWPAIGRAGLPRHLSLVVDAVAVRLGCIGKRFQERHHGRGTPLAFREAWRVVRPTSHQINLQPD